MPPYRSDSRIENLLSWLAASVLTAAAVIYAIKRDEDRRNEPQDRSHVAQSSVTDALQT